ncbi:MAG: ABC transporter substrate-binding protein [Clostridia bacterium]|nr:ABC transporter substrate-binding protein [Clostridia bacterium]
MKKLLSFLLCGTMLLGMAACGEDSTSTEKDTYTVGICQIQPHVALDAATQGVQDALKAELGDKVTFKVQDAGGDQSACTTIINSFVSENVDLILANATPVLQTAYNATQTIPILGTSVTEYGVALDIEGFSGTVGGNVSGTSDLAPLDQQAALFTELLPDKNTIGLIYCSAEANSKYQVEKVKGYLEAAGKTCKVYTFTDSNDMAGVCTTAVSECEALYVPTDNTVATYMSILDQVARPAKVPVITGEEGMCAGGGIATLSISYYDLGYATGKMAAKILKGEAKISEMPIEYAPEFTKKYNKAVCDELGITIPEGYTAIETSAE